ncbi:MAG: FCD domain-containing protein [Deltaproteobacteria bacterium]|nr:FCD domain-containing protein [Deltaproteobacteria bacterium]MBW1815785.1 FCD domain-containing protein [Deltaproteobacteria bacterium]
MPQYSLYGAHGHIVLGHDFNSEHQRILEAIKAGSPEQASQAMTEHLNHGHKTISRLICSKDPNSNLVA